MGVLGGTPDGQLDYPIIISLTRAQLDALETDANGLLVLGMVTMTDQEGITHDLKVTLSRQQVVAA